MAVAIWDLRPPSGVSVCLRCCSWLARQRRFCAYSPRPFCRQPTQPRRAVWSTSGWSAACCPAPAAALARACANASASTSRRAGRSVSCAALRAHCQARNIRLIYDLDDDLLDLSEAHPDAAHLRPLAPMVQAMLAAADTIWVSTPALVRRLGHHQAKALVVENGLDERLWWPPAAADRALNGPLRLLCMGTATHGADLALILPTLTRLQTEFGARVAIDIIGITSADLPPGLQRIDPPSAATHSYPAFINWLSQHDTWHLGLAPLADTPFNQGKSAIKAMDYAGLGIPTIASDIGVYNAAITDGINGMLVANTETAWFAALAGLLRDPNRRQQMAVAARSAFQERFSLAAQATTRKHALTGR